MRTKTIASFIRNLCGVLFWAYAVTKLLVFDIDHAAVRLVAPDLVWILNYKFFFILGSLATALIIFDVKSVLFFLVYVIFYPAIFLLWIVPKFIYQRQSWIIAFAATTFILAFIRSFKINVIFLATTAIATLTILVSSNGYVLILASMAIFLVLLYVYIRIIHTAFKKGEFVLFFKKLPEVRIQIVSNARLDDDLRNGVLINLSDEQRKKRLTKLDMPVAMSRIFLFAAKQFREYQRSPAPFVIATLSFFGLFFFTLSVFSLLHFALFKGAPAEFDISGATSFFKFVWYSFNAFVNNFVKEIVPAEMTAQILWMANVLFSLFLLTVVVSLYFSIRSTRNSQDIDLAVAAMESESRELESFILSEYKVESVEAAVNELAKAEASLFKVFLWLTSRLR